MYRRYWLTMKLDTESQIMKLSIRFNPSTDGVMLSHYSPWLFQDEHWDLPEVELRTKLWKVRSGENFGSVSLCRSY
jgi:hypothetical protein